MAPRRVIITIELESDRRIADLKAAIHDTATVLGTIRQIQVNVIRPDK